MLFKGLMVVILKISTTFNVYNWMNDQYCDNICHQFIQCVRDENKSKRKYGKYLFLNNYDVRKRKLC